MALHLFRIYLFLLFFAISSCGSTGGFQSCDTPSVNICLPGSVDPKCQGTKAGGINSSDSYNFTVLATGDYQAGGVQQYCQSPGVGSMPLPNDSANGCFTVACPGDGSHCPCAKGPSGSLLYPSDCSMYTNSSQTNSGQWLNTGIILNKTDTLDISATGTVTLAPAYGLSNNDPSNHPSPSASNPCVGSAAYDPSTGAISAACMAFEKNYCQPLYTTCSSTGSVNCGVSPSNKTFPTVSSTDCSSCITTPTATGCGAVLMNACNYLPLFTNIDDPTRGADNTSCAQCANASPLTGACVSLLTQACGATATNSSFCSALSCADSSAQCTDQLSACQNLQVGCMQNSTDPTCAGDPNYNICLKLAGGSTGGTSSAAGNVFANNGKGFLVPFYFDASTNVLASAPLTDGQIIGTPLIFANDASGNAIYTAPITQQFYPGQTVTISIDEPSNLLDVYYTLAPAQTSQYNSLKSQLLLGTYTYRETYVIQPPYPMWYHYVSYRGDGWKQCFMVDPPYTSSKYSSGCLGDKYPTGLDYCTCMMGENDHHGWATYNPPTFASGTYTLSTLCGNSINNFNTPIVIDSSLQTIISPANNNANSSNSSNPNLCQKTWKDYSYIAPSIYPTDQGNSLINASDSLIYIISYINVISESPSVYQQSLISGNLHYDTPALSGSFSPGLNLIYSGVPADGSGANKPPSASKGGENQIGQSDFYVAHTVEYNGSAVNSKIVGVQPSWFNAVFAGNSGGSPAPTSLSGAASNSLSYTYDGLACSDATGCKFSLVFNPGIKTAGGSANSPDLQNFNTNLANLISSMSENSVGGLANNGQPPSSNPVTNLSIAPVSQLLDQNTGIIKQIYDLKNLALKVNNDSSANITNGAFNGGINVFVKATPLEMNQGQNLYYAIQTTSAEPSGECTGNATNGNICGSINSFSAPSFVGGSGTLWLKIYDPTTVYTDNTGFYTAMISVSQQVYGFAQTLDQYIIEPMKKILQTTIQNMYSAYTCKNGMVSESCTNYGRMINFICTMYLVVTGITFSLGMLKISQMEFVTRLFKLAVVISCTNPSFLFFMSTDVLNGFWQYQTFFMSAAAGNKVLDINDPQNYNPFLVVGTIMDFILTPHFIKFFLAVFFTGIMGMVLALGFIIGLFFLFCAVIDLIKYYLKAVLYLGFIIAMGPIFIPFLLFNQTKHLFDKWWRYIIQFILEPVILISGMSILVSIAAVILVQVTNASVCFKCFGFLTTAFQGVKLFSFCLPGYVIWGASNTGVGKSIIEIVDPVSLVIFIIITYLLKNYTKFIDQISISLSSGGGGGGGVSTTGAVAQTDLLYKGGNGGQTTNEQVASKLGMTKEARAERKKQRAATAGAMAEKAKNPGAGGGAAANTGEKITGAIGKAVGLTPEKIARVGSTATEVANNVSTGVGAAQVAPGGAPPTPAAGQGRSVPAQAPGGEPPAQSGSTPAEGAAARAAPAGGGEGAGAAGSGAAAGAAGAGGGEGAGAAGTPAEGAGAAGSGAAAGAAGAPAADGAAGAGGRGDD